ncbi:MAG TPA: mechanosensitive ion channel family protein [Gemmatimonadaceae bacterium]|nr:mechanosensitive ion channel family protein [Gemmatimonadaceae bacterium]
MSEPRRMCLWSALRLACALIALLPGVLNAQPPTSAPATPGGAQTEPATDPLGRESPRGTVVGFIRVFRQNNAEAASVYLNTNLRGAAAAKLAQQLYMVLDSRLPARLTEVSDRPEGGLANPLKPDQDVVGTISTANGPLDVIVERVNRGPAGRIWLFSRQTLQAIPDVADEVNLVSVDPFIPRVMTVRIGGVRLFAWIVLTLLVPLSYWLIGLLGRLMGHFATFWRSPTRGSARQIFPGFVRLLILAGVLRWLVTALDLPLIERQFWTIVIAMFTIVSCVWVVLVLTTVGERYCLKRSRTSGHPEMTALLRLLRQATDVVVLALGGLLTLNYFGIAPTAVLAGLGIGGIAVALAAQKTLENVIGGLSIIFDKAVSVGDSLKLGDTEGTVASIGLRSTRIRTLDRTIVSVPNSQIATANIETLSSRDKFWFHHVVGLGYETTSEQMHAVLDGIRSHLAAHPTIDPREPIRVRFKRFGPFSLEIEVFAYVLAEDWDRFLETQQELLMAIMGLVERAGTAIALPSQVVQLADLDQVRTRPIGSPLAEQMRAAPGLPSPAR